MTKFKNRIFGVLSAGLMAALIAQAAPSITVAPTAQQIGPGATRQFTATTAELSDSSVTWSASAGTISATGLYTAPMQMPGQNPVTITATSVMTPAVSGSVFALLLAPGPSIVSVSPNPIPVGTVTLTVTGSGFLAGATVMLGAVQMSTQSVTPTTIKAVGYQGPATSARVFARNPGSEGSNQITVPVTGGSGAGGGGGGSAPVVTPANPTLVLGTTQQFAAAGATSWAAVAGTITASGFYTAPAAMPAAGTDTITATNAAGQGTTKVTLVSNVAPTIAQAAPASLPLGVFSMTLTGTGFTGTSKVSINGGALPTSFVNATTLGVTGFVGLAGLANLTVANGPLVSAPFAIQVGTANPLVSVSGSKRFLEQAAFGPTPADAAHVQAVGFQAWLNEQFAMPRVSNYNTSASQGVLPPLMLANAVTNPDQLRQRVAFALSQILVTSINKLIFNGNVIPYQHLLLDDALTNYRQILGDVTLNPSMGYYLDMVNNAKANPAQGTVANENFAREVLQLFTLGTNLLNPDGTLQPGPTPTYNQFTITEFARVFTGWTNAPVTPGGSTYFGSYINPNAPMVPITAYHDFGSKALLNGAVVPANPSPAADLNAALDNIFQHGNIAPFISKLLIQHMVKSNPSPTYVGRVSAAFANNGQGVRGDMKAVITAVLLDQEARANDNGGADQPGDGHLQEPVLFLTGLVRAFGGQMTPANYYASDMAAMGQDIFQAPSVFNYYSEGSRAPGTNLAGGEFQIHTANAAILRANLVANLFNQYSNPVQTYGPGTTVDLTPLLGLASTPSVLVDALDFTLTRGVMPAAMKQTIVTAVTNDSLGNLHRVQTGVYLILTSSYYNVWH